jgi:hypothetical protein
MDRFKTPNFPPPEFPNPNGYPVETGPRTSDIDPRQYSDSPPIPNGAIVGPQDPSEEETMLILAQLLEMLSLQRESE